MAGGSGIPADGRFRLRFVQDDGIVVYLNGKEIHRQNMPGVVGSPLNEDSKASTTISTLPMSCVTNVFLSITGLRTGTGTNTFGTNTLAVAVYQAAGAGAESDTWFGLEMDLVYVQTSHAPTNSPPGTPTLVRNVITSPQGRKMVLSWPATSYGYALQFSTNIVGTARNWWTNSANWTQVPDQSNPYTNAIPPTTGPRRYYRLFRETLN